MAVNSRPTGCSAVFLLLVGSLMFVGACYQIINGLRTGVIGIPRDNVRERKRSEEPLLFWWGIVVWIIFLGLAILMMSSFFDWPFS